MKRDFWINGLPYKISEQTKEKIVLKPISSEADQLRIRKWTKNKFRRLTRLEEFSYIELFHRGRKTYAFFKDSFLERHPSANSSYSYSYSYLNQIHYGLSICSPRDVYNRKLGDVIAICKLLGFKIPDFIYGK